jgi:pimeloyl-ACP methyl ester carboxylesterase
LLHLEPVGVPTLYVWSTDDAAFGRAAAEATRDCVQASYTFEVLEGVSHWVPETAPEQLSALLVRHLAST